MNEPPGARWRVGLTALTIAEYFRDEQRQNVLLLMDNVFRFVQAGSEVSGLLGRLPSRVGYQPTLASEVAALHERIASVVRRRGDRDRGGLRAGRRFHRSGGDRHLQPPRQHDRAVAADGGRGHVSGDRSPIASSSILLDPSVVGEEHYRIAEKVRETIAHYRELQDIISLLGIEELSAADRLHRRARPAPAALPDAALRRHRGVHRKARPLRPLADTLAGCQAILDGELRRLGGKLPLHGRHSRRGARQGSRQSPRRGPS